MARLHVLDLGETSKELWGFLFVCRELHVLQSDEHLSLSYRGALSLPVGLPRSQYAFQY